MLNYSYQYTPQAYDLLRCALVVGDHMEFSIRSEPANYWMTLLVTLSLDPVSAYPGTWTNDRIAKIQERAAPVVSYANAAIRTNPTFGINGPTYLEEYAEPVLATANFPQATPLTEDHLWWLAIRYQRILFPGEFRLHPDRLQQLQGNIRIATRLRLSAEEQPLPTVAPSRYRRRLY